MKRQLSVLTAVCIAAATFGATAQSSDVKEPAKATKDSASPSTSGSQPPEAKKYKPSYRHNVGS